MLGNSRDRMACRFIGDYGLLVSHKAKIYGAGQAERNIWGKAIRKGIPNGTWRRKALVIITKLYLGFESAGSKDQGLGCKYII
ncbi:hypothetical protein F441_00455 [Phytophthora nicotianae CJ01A1]|uniref:Uncharacterized protein n=2 Tax=Phytophthora nicotianae TaxID=4792 RepID=W2XVM2_PHYNI|nr:hypothetical protein L916_00430 [Phytophthora nicotianae]ETP26925.1 hypothetical protein F441_00455 [Phytophthora nicotianae CJ01A1]